MKKYIIKSRDEMFKIECDCIEVNDKEHLDIIINEGVEGCFNDWDYFYLELPLDEEEVKKYFQGFSYKPPKEDKKNVTVDDIILKLRELHNALSLKRE
jgi:hypothetical protein